MKKNFNSTENFFQDSLFILNSYGCDCAIDQINEAPGVVRHVFKVLAMTNKPVRFAFQPKTGLVRLADNGSVADDNVLGHLLAIKDGDINSYINFFQKNGFFFNTKHDEYEEINDETLLKFITRLKATVKLMSYISDNQRKYYKEILTLTLFLLLSPSETLQIGNHQYQTCKHTKLQEAINRGLNKKFNSFNQNPDEDWNIKIKDSIYGTYKIHIDLAKHYEADEDIFTPTMKKIVHSYFADKDAPKDIRIIEELLFHVLNDIGVFHKVTNEEIIFATSSIKWENYDDKLKAATIEVAKIVLGEEINDNVKGVAPEYDISIMEPRWKVDSLMSALYFSVFYMKPNMQITRQCANPRCNAFFTVPRTSSKKKYCSPACASRDCQNRYRANKKKLLESN